MSRAKLADSDTRGVPAGSALPVEPVGGTDAVDAAAPERGRSTRDSPGDLYRAGDVVEIVHVSRRQLQYWAQTDLIQPSAQTPGGHGRYTFEDLVALKAAKRLIDAGVSVQRIRRSIGALRKLLPTVHKPLSELVLVATGDVVLAFKDGAAFDAISGQEWVFEVARFQREVEAWRRSTRPPLTVGRARHASVPVTSSRSG